MALPRAGRYLVAFVTIASSALLFAGTAVALSAPTVLTMPTSGNPGASIRVNVSGFTSPAARTVQCVGLLGPGQNVELGLSPAFRPNLGSITVATSGEGQTNVTIPSNAVAGAYRIVVGGCSSNLTIAPLAPVASATFTVLGVTPPRLPASGGVPEIAPLLLGLILIVTGTVVRLVLRARQKPSG